MPANFYLAPRAGLDDFSGTEIGRAKHARRARATEGASQPAKLVRDGSEKFGEGRGRRTMPANFYLAPRAGLEPATR